MADLKKKMVRHLRSAKGWLSRAEESFDKDSDIRGELDLLLAQAELQHAREATRPRNRYRLPFLRQAVSLSLAAVIAASGFGAYWLTSRNEVVPIPLAAEKPKPATVVLTTVPADDSHPVSNVVSQPVVIAPEPVQVEPTKPAVQPVEAAKTARPAQAAQENLVSQDEMHKIIRAAGQSLRGQ